MVSLSRSQQVCTPDVSRLAAWPASEWRSFGRRLRQIGLNRRNLHSLAEVAPGQLPRLAHPIQSWLLAQKRKPFADAARLLLFMDRITRKEAVAAFGEDLLEKLLDIGLLVAGSGGALTSPFQMSVLKGKYVLADDLRNGADAVMSSGGTTSALVEAVYPSRKLRLALDLGCGAGAMAIVLAERAEKVIATDINPRALVFGRINAAINGIDNVEFRQGDLFAPVAEEEFDLIVSQPPFIPMPEGSPPTTYLFGGPRGDELPMQLLAGVSAHLADGGRAVVLTQWPEIAGESIVRRVRGAVASPDTDVLLVMYPPLGLGSFAIAYSAHDLRELGEQFEIELVRWRDHFERLKIKRFRPCFNVLRRRKQQRGWTRAVYPTQGVATEDGIDQILRGCDLLHDGKDAILRSTLRIPQGAFITEKQTLGNVTKPTIQMGFNDRTMGRPAEINDAMLRLLKSVHRANTVKQGIAAYAARKRGAADILLPQVRNALELGLLEVRESQVSRRTK